MNKKDLDSSMNSYRKKIYLKRYIKQLQWDMAIGLQQVDNLKPSKYLEQIKEKNILGELTIKESEQSLRDYYTTKEKPKDINCNELECDFVSMRIVELLDQDNFELSVDYLKSIHKYLFQDVYEFAGEFRKIDFSKHEKILNNDSVAYGNFKTLTESLEYDISLEKEKDYKDMNIAEAIKNITDFTSNIWQVHPFREGNTRTTAVFIYKYLNSLEFNQNISIYKNKASYFKNALVRSNYFNNYLNIKEDKIYLIKFYENLLLNKNNNLHSEDLIIKELF